MRIKIKIKYSGNKKIEERKQKTKKGRISNRLRKNIFLTKSSSGI